MAAEKARQKCIDQTAEGSSTELQWKAWFRKGGSRGYKLTPPQISGFDLLRRRIYVNSSTRLLLPYLFEIFLSYKKFFCILLFTLFSLFHTWTIVYILTALFYTWVTTFHNYLIIYFLIKSIFQNYFFLVNLSEKTLLLALVFKPIYPFYNSQRIPLCCQINNLFYFNRIKMGGCFSLSQRGERKFEQK